VAGQVLGQPPAKAQVVMVVVVTLLAPQIKAMLAQLTLAVVVAAAVTKRVALHKAAAPVVLVL
jgi:hypothetical protein